MAAIEAGHQRQSYLFVSYAKVDYERISPLLRAVEAEFRARALPISLWVDMLNLMPGQQWERAINDALELSSGFLFIASLASVDSPSVRREIGFALERDKPLIIPVILDAQIKLPLGLSSFHAIDFSRNWTSEHEAAVAVEIALDVEHYLQHTPVSPDSLSGDAPALAAALAEELRAPTKESSIGDRETTIFVVHGHSQSGLAKLETYLASVGIDALVLARLDEHPQSLFQKFMSIANKAKFAVVLLSSDDYGASRRQYDIKNVADRALKFRARQNVILELGFFYGRLGWENVFVVCEKSNVGFPDFERPSDLDGVIFDSLSDTAWEKKLGTRLELAGFRLTPKN